MKKYLIIVLAAISLFVSCSSSPTEPSGQSSVKNPIEIPYTVTDLSGNPLTLDPYNTNPDSPTFYGYTVNSGEAVEMKITLTLPEGITFNKSFTANEDFDMPLYSITLSNAENYRPFSIFYLTVFEDVSAGDSSITLKLNITTGHSSSAANVVFEFDSTVLNGIEDNTATADWPIYIKTVC